MSLVEKTKNALDWLARGQVLFQIFVSFGLGAIVKNMVGIYTNLNPIWITPIWLLSSALFFGGLLVLFNEVKKRIPTQQRALAVSAIQSPITLSSLLGKEQSPEFDSVGFFKFAYHSPLTAEAEKNMHIIADKECPQDEVGYLCRFIGVGITAHLYEMAWAYIFRSQLLMLLEINRRNGYLPMTEAKTFYDKAAMAFPNLYATYPFTSWLEFIKNQRLLIEHPSQMLEITHMGKDFLKYLTHRGYGPDMRAN